MGGAPSLPEYPQAVIVSKGDETYGDIYRNAKSPDKLIDSLNGNNTLYENFQAAVKNFPDRPCAGVRKGATFQFQTYGEVSTRATNFGSGLIALGHEKGSMIGLYSKNNMEWLIAAQATNAYTMVNVALYDTLGPEACKYIIEQTEITTVVVQEDAVAKILAITDALPKLKNVIVIAQAVSEEHKKALSAVDINALTFQEVEDMGKEAPKDHVPPKPEDLSVLCYTSGTTGNPKGVMLTHRNYIADVGGVLATGFNFNPDDVLVSYLPMAHCFERALQEGVFSEGACLGFYGGDITKLMEDIGILRPTIFPSVPRLLNKLCDKVNAGVRAKGGVAESLFNRGFEAKKEALAEGWLTHGLWDRVVFKNLAAKLGGRVRAIITGAAPISDTVMEFLRIGFSCPVMEGYGQTECAAACTITLSNDPELGHVGPPLPCCEMRLQSVPEMNYTVSDKPFPRGEICVRGFNVCAGYYKMPEKTAATIDEDGWLHTGDIGMWKPNGTLKIVDRVKNIFKLAQGEYVAPEKIENTYLRSPWVGQAFVYGNSLKASLVAVVVPDFEVLGPWAEANGHLSDPEELAQNKEVTKMILEDMRTLGKDSGLHGFEQVRGIVLAAEPFTVENDLLTPTFKLKRPNALKMYQERVDAVYKDLQ